jgi:hypothetical protein
MGLKHREFQDVGGLPSASAGGVISTGIPQGGAGILAPVSCISWEGGKPGSKKNVRNVVFFVEFGAQGTILQGQTTLHIEILPRSS